MIRQLVAGLPCGAPRDPGGEVVSEETGRPATQQY